MIDDLWGEGENCHEKSMVGHMPHHTLFLALDSWNSNIDIVDRFRQTMGLKVGFQGNSAEHIFSALFVTGMLKLFVTYRTVVFKRPGAYNFGGLFTPGAYTRQALIQDPFLVL